MDEHENIKFFERFYERYFSIYQERIRLTSEINKMDLEYPSVYKYLYDEFVSITYMTLVYELNYHRESNQLQGENSKDRYLYFNKIIGEKQFYLYMKKKYPVLDKLIKQKINHVILCVETIVKAFKNDCHLLEKKFNRKFIKIDDITIGEGDVHETGKTVAILSGKFGKIVYKPHDLLNDEVLAELISILNKKHKLKLKHIVTIDRGTYGWQEFIEYKACNNILEVKNYYYRLGSYLAIFFILNSTDMHFENIISFGEYPYIVDTETLISISKFKNEDLELYAHKFALDNVLTTGLLPINNPESVMDIDMSGLSGGNFQSKKMKVYKIENELTDRMKVVKELINTTYEKQHIPRITNKYVKIVDYFDSFNNGFVDSMNIFLEKKDELLNWLSNSSISKTKQRQLFRNTYVYAKFLEAGHHPSYLTSFQKRENLMKNIFSKNITEREKNELKILFDGNIPSYYSKFNSTALFQVEKTIKDKYFLSTAEQTARYKIFSLSKETIRFQSHLIKLSYATLVEKLIQQPEKELKNVSESDSYYLGTSETIINNILSNSISKPHSSDQDLYMVKLYADSQSIQGVNLSIFEGGGLIWTTYCFGRQLKNEEIKLTSLSWLKAAEERIRQDSLNIGTSLFEGVGSLVYLFFNFYRLTGEEYYYLRFRKYLKILVDDIKNIHLIDYMHGISGVLDLLYKIWKIEPEDEILDALNLIIKHFRKLLDGNHDICKESGLAHGLSGIILALMRSYEVTKDSYFLDRAKIYLYKEEKIIDKSNISWCRGLIGIVLSRKEILTNIDECNELYPELIRQFHLYLKIVLEVECTRNENLCLCHGHFGKVDVLNNIYVTGDEILTKNEKKEIAAILSEVNNVLSISKEDLWMTFDFPLETFMLGKSGIAYTMLRMNNTNFPSILSLEIA